MRICGFAIEWMGNGILPWPNFFSCWRLVNAWQFRIWRLWILIHCWYNRNVLEAYKRDYGLESRREVRRFFRKIRTQGKGGRED